jgi:predicted DCC family thiol-disulfide oxidoreductase YuxK
MNSGGLGAALAAWCGARYGAVTTRRFAAPGLAVLRIGYGSVWVLFLLREWGERDAAWGPGAAWSPAIERQYAAQSNWTGLPRLWLTLVARLTGSEFDFFYLGAIAVGMAFALGWHTRVASVLFAVVVVALENRAPLLTDGGDNVLTLMSVYLAFTSCGEYWSLDARRRSLRLTRVLGAQVGSGQATLPAGSGTRTGTGTGTGTDAGVGGGVQSGSSSWLGELAAARLRLVTVAHNGAVIAVAAQICVVYGTAGFLKVQGSMWQDGSALGYVLRLDWFQPWPGLSTWLVGQAAAAALVGYVTVLVQAGFPFIVFAPRLKYPALAVLVMMHLSIAVLLGLPFFSAIMLVSDAVFLPDRFWLGAVRRLLGPSYARGMGTVGMVQPTLVFDGDCGFCTASVEWLKRWCRPAVRFVPWQRLDLAAHGLTEAQVAAAVQWLPQSDARIRPGAAAVARVLLRSRWPWRPIGVLMLTPPISWGAAAVYRLISANRYRLPGSTPACAPGGPSAASVATNQPDVAIPGPGLPVSESAQHLGDLGGGAHDPRTGAGGVELAERDHAD